VRFRKPHPLRVGRMSLYSVGIVLFRRKLFEEKKVSLGKASEIAGYTEKAFSEILFKRGISPVTPSL